MSSDTISSKLRSAIVLFGIFVMGSSSAVGAAAQASHRDVSGKLELEIGRTPENDDFFLERVVGIAVDADGRLFVLDNGAKDVKVFDSRGRFLHSFGREGSGPGEFNVPIALTIANDSLVVTDGMLRRISVFDLEGRHLKTERLPSLEQDRPMYRVIPLRGGAVASISIPQFSDARAAHDPYVRILLRRSPERGADTLASIRGDGVLYTVAGPMRVRGMFTPGFGDGGAWAVSGDTLLAVADGYSGQIRWFKFDDSGHRVQASATVPGTPRRVSSQDLREADRRNKEGSSNPAALREERILVDPPPYWSNITGAVFADNGDLWISGPPNKNVSTRWTVFTPNGRRRFTIGLPVSFSLKAVAGGRIYGSSPSTDGTPVIQVFSMMPVRERLGVGAVAAPRRDVHPLRAAFLDDEDEGAAIALDDRARGNEPPSTPDLSMALARRARNAGGTRVSTLNLQRTITAYQQALTVNVRVHAACIMATQNNLGGALTALGQRTEDKRLLDLARDELYAALMVHLRTGSPQGVATIQRNRANARRPWGAGARDRYAACDGEDVRPTLNARRREPGPLEEADLRRMNARSKGQCRTVTHASLLPLRWDKADERKYRSQGSVPVRHHPNPGVIYMIYADWQAPLAGYMAL